MPIKVVFDGPTRLRTLRDVELEKAETWWVCKGCGGCYPKPLRYGCHCNDAAVEAGVHWAHPPSGEGSALTEVPADQRKSFEAARRLGGKAAVKALAETL